ncbi:MAG: AraC family transcriptional regulator [Bacteroidota bacterium]
MQPLLITHKPGENTTFKTWRNAGPYVHNLWHFHEVFEITYIEKGCGTRFIGDHIQQYGDNDLVLLGSNVPHEWRSDFKGDMKADYSTRSLAVHFERDFAGKAFFDLPEMESVSSLLNSSSRGISIVDVGARKKIHRLLIQLVNLQGAERIIKFISILVLIAEAQGNKLLASQELVASYERSKDYRINEVYKFIANNFKNDITLDDMAAVVSMSTNSFCRYFKKCADKTPVRYLNEIRTGFACKLLMEGNLNVAQCAHESGFNNLANFNRRFKLLLGKTPKEYMNHGIYDVQKS